MKRNSPKILLIDDNQHGLVARRCFLEELGYTVEIACGGAAGMRKFADQEFDLVVTDYRMPDLCGADVLKQIRERNSNIPLVLLSGYALKLGLTEAATGADAVLMKGPSEHDDLVRAIGRLIKRRPSVARNSTASSCSGQRAVRF